jgi:putative MATE family efflux protein
MLATQLYSVADTMVIGLKLDASALAAVSNASSILWIFLFISGGIELGSNLLIGSKKPVMSDKEVSDVAYNIIFEDFSASIIITVIGFFAFPTFLRMINTPSEIMADAVTYGRIYTLAIPFLMYYDVSKEILIGVGDSKIPLYFVVATSVLNIILDIILTGPMGVAGAAVASAAAQVVGSVIVTFALKKRVLIGGFSFKVLNKSTLIEIFRLSFPNILQQMTGPIASNVRQSLLGTLGVGAIAGYSCASKLLTLTSMALGGYTQGLVIFIAQNHALGNKDRMRAGIKESVKIQGIFVAVMVAVFAILRNPLLRLFTSDSEAIAYGGMLLLWEPTVYFIQIIKFAQEAKLRGRKKMTLYTISSLSTMAVNLISSVLLVSRVGFKGFYIASYISAIYAAGISTIFARKVEKAENF